MTATACPGDARLLDLAKTGTGPDELLQHIPTCDTCRPRFEHFRKEMAAVRLAAALAHPFGAGLRSSVEEVPGERRAADLAPTSHGPVDAARSEIPESIGRYRILDEVDSGGQAIVYRAAHPNLPGDLALKIARHPVALDQGELAREAKVLRQLDHPNLVQVFDLDIHDGRPFVVMELVHGRNLAQVIEEHGCPGPRQAAVWISGVALALGAVHRRGIVHQDIKPANILLDESGCPRLIDFGIARLRHAWSDEARGPTGGTYAFMPPEQARGEETRIGPRSDVFGLAGVLYFLLTGKAPFEADGPKLQWARARACEFDRGALRAAGVPRRLERVVLKALSAEPEQRHASADALAAALTAFLRRPYRTAALAGMLLLAAVAFGGWSRWPTHATPIARERLKIESLQVELHRRSTKTYVGPIGTAAFEGQVNDDVRVAARLSTTAYCYLIALNPNGKDQLCFPADPKTAPPAVAEIDFPPDPSAGFGLTDGAGEQAFVLLASRSPLPPFAEWRRALNDFPWRRSDEAGVWRFNGRTFERDIQRGEVRALADLPPALEAACRSLQDRPGIAAIQALAFPVKQKSGSAD